MLIGFKIIILLFAVNAAPPVIAFLFEDRWNRPIDRNRTFLDGKPLLGSHKTIRGIIGSLSAGILLGWFLGLPLIVGFCIGFFSMLGDLLTSFFKRRFALASGTAIPLFDQLFEGIFPLLFVKYYFLSDWALIIVLLILFVPITHFGALFFKKKILPAPHEKNLRLVKSRTRFRVWRACHIALPPLQRYLNFENIIYHEWIITGFLKLIKKYDTGVRNALDVQFRQIELRFSDLPVSFDSYRILFMSDLHLDGLPGITERVIDIVSGIECDSCIIGGDIRYEMFGSSFLATRRLRQIVKNIKAKDGVFGVPGNHDCIEIIPDLEDAGVWMLVNDAYPLKRNGETIWLVGVDDPHYYRAHDLNAAFKEVPENAFNIFAAHSPEAYKDAAQHMARLYLCGHTHGGQVRLPFYDGPIITHSRAPRKIASGLWKYKDMFGYTSSGVGASGVPVRFNCPGEIVLFTLKKK
ncbi:MAG: CDP-archaeol synthase [Desulfobacterales bacterium]|nr:CDP-archaeol synthase [Desulfobacterales bacterium]